MDVTTIRTIHTQFSATGDYNNKSANYWESKKLKPVDGRTDVVTDYFCVIKVFVT